LSDEKHDQTIGIKCCQMKRLLELRTIKVRKLLPDEKHDRTFEIKFCQTKSMTVLLELILPNKKHDRTIGIKYCQTKSITGLLELRTIEVKSITAFAGLRDNDHLSKSQSFRTGGFKYHKISMSVK
ncbi:hypothetical protein RclHR1_13690001, partial [Rhizophagus clarus]